MATEKELERTLQETQQTFQKFDDLQRQLEEIEEKKQGFAREFGVDFDEVTTWVAAEGKAKFQQGLSAAEQQKIKAEEAAFQADLQRELEQAELRFREEKGMQPKSVLKPSRLRKMI